MDLPELSGLSYRERAERLADAATRALRQDRLEDATALAAVAQAHAAIAALPEDLPDSVVIHDVSSSPLSVTRNKRVREVAAFLKRHAGRPVSNKEVRQSLGLNDVQASNALRDAAAVGLAVKMSQGVWRAP